VQTSPRRASRFRAQATDSEDPLAQASWGANYPRLRLLKRKYDPENLFRHNHNIAPAD
jgi:FAD/FMN-containing dehydrogenase